MALASWISRPEVLPHRLVAATIIVATFCASAGALDEPECPGL
jgi:hypothetical protein